MTTHEMMMDERIAYVREHVAERLAEDETEMEPCLTEEEVAGSSGGIVCACQRATGASW
jgi:hypothetical protein